MARAIPLITGSRIYAGANLPFYVSQGMVTGYLENRGFRNIKWHKRSEPLPPGLDPQKDPQYDDDWDVWAEGQYSGLQSGQLNPPADPAWMRVELPAVGTGATPGPATATPPAATVPSPPGLPARPPAPLASISSDPVIVRKRRVGIAVAIFGALLATAGLGWTIMSRRSAEPAAPAEES